MECVVEEYLKFTNNFFNNYYRILLDKNYNKKIVDPFISKYIEVRYYNNSVFRGEKNFLEKINRELYGIAKSLMEENPEEDLIKNTYALFTYLLYLDDCYEYKSVSTLIKNLFEDKNIKLVYTEETKKEFKKIVEEYLEQKKDFTSTFNIKDFTIRETKISNHLYETTLDYNFEVNKLYSDYAIETAYSSDIVKENRLYLLILMLSKNIIDLILKMDYNKRYIVNMPLTLIQKPKKQKRFLRALDNDILKNRISLKIKYSDYSANREQINSLISNGYSFTIELDNTFTTDDINCLVLFNYIIVYQKENYYDTVINYRNNIDTNIIII